MSSIRLLAVHSPLRLLLLLLACPFGGCVTTGTEKPQANPELIETHRARLLRCFDRNYVVHCKTLTIEANPVFLTECFLPAGNPKRSEGEGYQDSRWFAIWSGGAQAKNSAHASYVPISHKLIVKIGKTIFKVDSTVRVRRLFRAVPTLTVRAAGRVILVTDGKDTEQLAEVRFADGRIFPRAR